ncbi:MAG TPA: hypothetical protein V6C65_15920 [Allocoleopsis sp.]
MQPSTDETPERKLLRQHPGIREFVESLSEYTQWRANLATVSIDAERFFVMGGDQLKDDDQILVEWIRLFRPELIKD